jgi:hypothetical protein
MKKITLFISLVFGISLTAQNVIGIGAGINQSLETGGGTSIGGSAMFQRGFGDNLVGGLEAGFWSASGVSTIQAGPRVDYYFKSAFDGFHAGIAPLFASTSGFKAVAINLNIGYTHSLNDKMLLDVTAFPNIAMSLETGGGSPKGVGARVGIGFKL